MGPDSQDLSQQIDEASDRFGTDGPSQTLVEKRTALLLPSLSLKEFKDLLADDRYRIQLHDALVSEVRAVRGRLTEEHFPIRNVHTLSIEDYLAQVERYEALTSPLLAIMAAGGYWADGEQVRLLGRCLSRLADPPGERNGLTVLLNLRLYPALLLTYACGIGAILAGRYATLATLLVSARTWKDNKQEPLVRALAHKDVIDGGILQRRPELERHKTPVSDHLFILLKEPLGACAIDEGEYQRAFDRFEYLYALIHSDLYEKESPTGHTWGPIGCFLWRRGILDEVGREIADQAEGWPPLRAGLFGGSVERLKHVKEQIDGIVHRSGW
jgi:hypothetical protein